MHASSKCILIVDNDPDFGPRLREFLDGAGYKVLVVQSGAEAVRTLERMTTGIDLIMLELATPGISGFELIGMLTRRPNPIKIIAFSRVHKAAYLKLARDLGAHASLPKPGTGEAVPEDWLETVQRLLS